MTRKDRALKYVNRIRVEYGIGEPLDEFPKGKLRHASCCPVARAVNGWAGTDVVIVRGPQGGIVATPPKYVREFIEVFDKGRYRELIER